MFGKAIVTGLLALTIVTSAVLAQTVSVDLVPVGNAGNAADTRYDASGFGSVGYDFQIGKYEITAGQYTEFLKLKAKSDPYGLYNPSMGYLDMGCGIHCTGTPGSFSYSVVPECADRPVKTVSFWDACRFVNWLENGQGDGSTETGAYDLNGYNGAQGTNIVRNTNAKWCLPSENEWYKAAYHDKNAGLLPAYFDYPTRTNIQPGRDMTEATNTGNNANHQGGLQPVAPYPIDSNFYYTTIKGEFESSDSPYGTFDQGGNVFEWNDTVMNTWGIRGARGGSYNSGPDALLASTRFITTNNWPPNYDASPFGFRVAFIPEPGSLTLLLVGGTSLFAVMIARRCSKWVAV